MPLEIGGLFVGVSAQEDPRLSALQYAARDAERLWAVFADAAVEATGDHSSVGLLANEQATVPALLALLEGAIARSNDRPFDLFVVHLSCHGLPQGQVLLYDAVYDEAGYNALALSQLNEGLARLRASTLVVTLDICFGGTVVGLDGSANREALHAVLEGLAGQNRAIAWAAGANEPAHESHRARHGYLSMGLLRSIVRAREAARREIPATQWLHEAMEVARDEALRLGKPQTPQLASRLGPSAVIPIPPVGSNQVRLATGEGITVVGADLAGLDRYGWPSPMIEAVRAKLVGSTGLNDLQQRAISPSGILVGRDIVVRAPTSAGKTLVAELAILRVFAQRLKAIVLVPTRALASEHATTFAHSYGHLGLRVIRSAGDAADDDDLLMRGHFDVAVITYEKFASLVYRDVALLDAVGLVVLDEVQLIRDSERGRVPELLLALLQQRRQRGLTIQSVALCGDFADLGGLPEWLGAELVGEVIRPVPLREGVIDPSGRITSTWRNEKGVEELQVDLPRLEVGGNAAQQPHVARERTAESLIAKLTAEGKQILVFRTSRSSVLKMARRLAGALGLNETPDLLADFDLSCQRHERSRVTTVLRTTVKRGVGFHSSQLEEHERIFLEQAFRDRRLKVLVTTTTLAAGVNLPAHAVVIVDHVFYRGPNEPAPLLDSVDYRNMVGRAGRAGQGMASGEAYLIAGSGPERATLAERYVTGGGVRLEAGLGNMSPSDRTLAAAAVLRTGTLLGLVEVLSNTFWGYQLRHDAAWREQLRQETDDALERLTAAGLLTRVNGREYALTPAGATCALYGLSVESAERVLETVGRMTEQGEPVATDELVALTQLAVELEEYLPVGGGETVEMWRARLGSWGRARPALLEALERPWGNAIAPHDVLRRLKRLALLRGWLSGRPVDEVETAVGLAPEEPVLSYVRDMARRTNDLLSGVAGLVINRQPERQLEIQALVQTLRPALEFGVTLAAASLQRQRLGLTRKQNLALARDGVTTLEKLEEVMAREPARLEGLLSTPVFYELRATLDNRSLKRRRRLQTGPADDTLSLFPDGPLA